MTEDSILPKKTGRKPLPKTPDDGKLGMSQETATGRRNALRRSFSFAYGRCIQKKSELGRLLRTAQHLLLEMPRARVDGPPVTQEASTLRMNAMGGSRRFKGPSHHYGYWYNQADDSMNEVMAHYGSVLAASDTSRHRFILPSQNQQALSYAPYSFD